VDSIYDIVWARDPLTGTEVRYRDVRYQEELQVSVFNFEAADVEKTWKHLELYEAECQALIDRFNRLQGDKTLTADALARFPLLGAYDLCLKCSHLFNILDARGAISVTERVGVIARIRNLAVGLAKAYLVQQSVQGEQPTQKAGAA
jgi:glycyl-tRNA synthetase alpha chain